MAKTVATAKSARKAAAKPKVQPVASKAKATPKAPPRKRKGALSPNPFDEPPDTTQCSTLTYTASSHRSDPETPSQLQPEVAQTETKQRVEQKDSSSFAELSGNPKMSSEKSITMGSDIQLADVITSAYNLWNSRSDNWMSDLHDMCIKFDEQQFMSLIGQCTQHELFDAHCKSVIESADLDDNEWVFGCADSGDPLEDLVEMLRWLTLRHASTTTAVAPSTNEDVSYPCH